MKRPDVALYEKFLATQTDRTLVPPEVKKEVPLRYFPEVDDYAMSAGMALTRGGRIWLAWFAGGDNENAVMLLARSDDGGKSFSDPQFILDPGYAEAGIHISAVVGNLWTAPDGRLFFFFTVSLGHFDGRSGSWYSVCENPDGEFPVWSPAIRIWHGASLNKPTVLADGTWLLPISLWSRSIINIEMGSVEKPVLNLFSELDAERMAWVFASSDGGRNWERRGGVRNQKPTFDEPMILERRDGSLLMYLRYREGMTQSESFDGGRSWSAPVPTLFPSASARFFLCRLSSGNALLVKYSNPEEPQTRSHLTAYVSKDDGATWEGGLLLDERTGVSYPDGFQQEDGRILIQYDRLREHGEILLAVFTEEDVLAGKDVSGKVVLKQPMVRSRSARLEAEHAQ